MKLSDHWTPPKAWTPATVDDLIGESLRVGKILRAKVARLLSAGGTFTPLFYGEPGCGKSSLAYLMTSLLTGEPVDRITSKRHSSFFIDRKAGQDVTVEVIREWEAALATPSLFQGWHVKLVNEIDLVTPAAQSRLLEYLDLLPDRHAFIGTSNAQIDTLHERFQTRMQPWKITSPSTEEIILFLRKNWPISMTAAKAIAVGSGGNVRAACLDTESELDVLLAA